MQNQNKSLLLKIIKRPVFWILVFAMTALLMAVVRMSLTALLLVILIFAAGVTAVLTVLGKNCVGPMVPLGMKLVVWDLHKTYKNRPFGEIIFYGASNFTLWKTLEQDMLPWHTQNHGFGGSTDSLMIKYAPQMLYPYKPSVVFIQTGSNDNAQGLSLAQIMENKRKLYCEFRKNLPDTKFIVMSGLPLPGREEFLDSILELNTFLKQYILDLDGFYFIDATESMMEDGKTRPEYFIEDGIHLNATGHAAWSALMREKLEELHIPHA